MSFWDFANAHPVAATFMVIFAAAGISNIVKITVKK